MLYKINYYVIEVIVIMNGFMVIININLAFDFEINYDKIYFRFSFLVREFIEL